MSKTADELMEAAMHLPGRERARLADMLVESLDAEGLSEIDRLWLDVAMRRLDELRSGAVTPIDAVEAIRRARAAIGE